MRHARVEVEHSSKRRFKTTIYTEIPHSEDRIFKDWLFYFQADLLHDIQTIVVGFSPHINKKTMIDILDRNVPEWREENLKAIEKVWGKAKETVMTATLEREALNEWKAYALKTLKDANVDGIWELEFEDETGAIEISPKEKGVAIQLFAGIEHSVKMFASKYKPSIIIYEAAASERSKVKLYETLGNRIQKHGYVPLPKSMLALLTEVEYKSFGYVEKSKWKVIKEVFGL